MKSDHFSS